MRSSALLLEQLTSRKNILCDHLFNNYSNNTFVKSLLRKRNVRIEQRDGSISDSAAYSVNKGDYIGICLKHNDINDTVYVLLHELAHIMSPNYKHDAVFWTNFAFLVAEAVDIGIYTYVDYKTKKTTFCGTVIQ